MRFHDLTASDLELISQADNGVLAFEALRDRYPDDCPSKRTVQRWVASMMVDGEEAAVEAPILAPVEPVEEVEPRDWSRPGRDKLDPRSVLRGMKVLVIDIETKPAVVETYQLFNVSPGHRSVILPGSIACFSALWLNDPKTTFFLSEFDGRERMLGALWQALDTADIVVSYNGRRFDIPRITGELAENGYYPPSPFLHLDLMVEAAKIKAESRALDYVSRRMGTQRKLEGAGAGGWRAAWGITQDTPADERISRMIYPERWPQTESSRAALAELRSYNRTDVLSTMELMLAMLPYTRQQLSRTGCRRCGNHGYEMTGKVDRTPQMTYRLVRCSTCGGLDRLGRGKAIVPDLEFRRRAA